MPDALNREPGASKPSQRKADEPARKRPPAEEPRARDGPSLGNDPAGKMEREAARLAVTAFTCPRGATVAFRRKPATQVRLLARTSALHWASAG